MNLEGVFGVLKVIAEYGTTGMEFLNKYIFSNAGSLMGVFQKIIDFFKNLFSGEGGGIGDFFKGLFG